TPANRNTPCYQRKVCTAAHSNSGKIDPGQVDRFASLWASPTKRRPFMAILRTGLTLLIGLGMMSSTARAEPPEDTSNRRVDLYGDPLPEGAIAGCGTSRLRHAENVYAIAFSAD